MINNFVCQVGLHLRSIEEPRMTAETAAPCVQGMQGVQTAMAGQGALQQVQDGKSTGGYYSSTSAVYDPEYARMEAWLDEHPDFVNDYFLRFVPLSLSLSLLLMLFIDQISKIN